MPARDGQDRRCQRGSARACQQRAFLVFWLLSPDLPVGDGVVSEK